MSPTEGRKFGLTLGGAFLVIAAALWWRGRESAVPYVAGLAGGLILAGLLVPTLLGPVNRAWMGLSHLLSKVTTPIFMGGLYFLIFTPVAFGMRLIGRRPLKPLEANGGFWSERGTEPPDPNRMKRQF